MTGVAVLGLGSIGLRHARNLLALGERVVGFDPDPARRAAAAELGASTAITRDSALESVAAVVIATPNGSHLDDLTAAAAAGRHAFVEKPLAHTDAGIDAVLDAFEARRLVVFAGLVLRFHPTVDLAAKMVADGALGTVLWGRLQMSDYLPGWRPAQDYRRGYTADAATGGVLLDVIHEFDVANLLLGPATTVAAAARRSGVLDIASEDCADVILRHEHGALSSLHLDYVTRPRRRRTTIAGSEGILDLDLDARRLVFTGHDGRVLDDTTSPGSYADDFVAEMRSFLACMRHEAQPPCDGRAARAVLGQVLEARRLCNLPQA